MVLYKELQKYSKPLNIIVINGNLERLRNGYYPSFFYPRLAQANKQFYQSFISAYNLKPIAINGDRYAVWLIRNFPQSWQLFAKTPSNNYEMKQEFPQEPEATVTWNLAKKFIANR